MLTITKPTHPLSAPAADAIRCALWSTEHIPVDVHVDQNGLVNIWAVGRPLTTAEEVSALRAFIGATDSRVRWFQGVGA
jgi:hypothetical protein